jgi:hypothetical protein
MNKLVVLGAALFKLMAGDSKLYRSVLVKLIWIILALGVSFALIFVGLGFIIWAFYLYLTSFLQAHIAALITGLVILLIVAALLFGMKLLTVYVPGKSKKRAAVHGTESGAIAEGLSLVRDYPGETLLAALAAGLLVGVSSAVRKVLTVAIVWLLTENSSKKHSED